VELLQRTFVGLQPRFPRRVLLLHAKLETNMAAPLPSKPMRRRDFVAGVIGTTAAWPFAARAQQRERVRRMAWLGAGRADEPSPYLDSLRAGLRESGWTEGRNLTR
jgi:hypothetical protein